MERVKIKGKDTEQPFEKGEFSPVGPVIGWNRFDCEVPVPNTKTTSQKQLEFLPRTLLGHGDKREISLSHTCKMPGVQQFKHQFFYTVSTYKIL